jgi:hypothetical protein
MSHPTLCRVKERLTATYRKEENLVEPCGINRSAVGRDHIRPRLENCQTLTAINAASASLPRGRCKF